MAFDTHTSGVLAFSTSNYDAMKKFFADFGFEVAEGHDQLLPLFGGPRGARVSRGELRFQLEESDDPQHQALFNLFLTDYSDEEINRIKARGYKCDRQVSLYGEFHSVRTPDGGTIVI
jgi:hypothetical protein